MTARLVAGDCCVLRTARKPWTCVAGGCAIVPGERYLEYLGESPADTSGSRYCLTCAQTAGLAQPADLIAEALEPLAPRLRRIVDGAPATLIVPEAAGGPSAHELAIATTMVRLLRLARAARPPAGPTPNTRVSDQTPGPDGARPR